MEQSKSWPFSEIVWEVELKRGRKCLENTFHLGDPVKNGYLGHLKFTSLDNENFPIWAEDLDIQTMFSLRTQLPERIDWLVLLVSSLPQDHQPISGGKELQDLCWWIKKDTGLRSVFNSKHIKDT